MKRVSYVLLALAALAGASSPAAAWEPKGQGECIAPSNPGGGWDMICRTTASLLQKSGVYKDSIYVTNMPGGSGAVGIANVVAKRKADTNLIVAASNSLTFTIALRRTPHTYKDVIPIAQIVADLGGFFVKTDSKLKTLDDLVQALKADPRSVSFGGGSAPGGGDHIRTAIFAKAIGIDPTKLAFVPFQGGGEALNSLLGGHIQVATMDLSEAAGQMDAGAVRALALTSETRSKKYPNIPTTFDQGVKASFTLWRGFYMAPGTPPDAVVWWTNAIRNMTNSPEWKAELDKLGWEPVARFGDDFAKYASAEEEEYRALLKELGFVK